MDQNYLSKFREKAGKGAFVLFKRVWMPNVVLNLVMSLIFLAIFIPLILYAFGWSAEQISEFNEKLVGIGKSGGMEDKPRTVFSNLFVDFAFGFLILALVMGFIMFSYMYFTYLKNYENINNNNEGLSTLRNSFSSRIWTILASIIFFILVSFVLYLIYFELIALIFRVSRFWGITTGFLGFFVMMAFFMRFIMVIPAIVQDNRSIFLLFRFNNRHMTWKRYGILLILELILTASLSVIMLLIFYTVSSALISGDSENSILAFIVLQLLFAITGAAVAAFIYTSLRALYYKYSEEGTGKQ